jgi:hypothetical protein
LNKSKKLEKFTVPLGSLQPTAIVAYWANVGAFGGPRHTVTAHQRQGFHLAHPHGSSYEPQHLNLEVVVGRRGLTSKAVRVVVTDGVEGGNCN